METGKEQEAHPLDDYFAELIRLAPADNDKPKWHMSSKSVYLCCLQHDLHVLLDVALMSFSQSQLSMLLQAPPPWPSPPLTLPRPS